MKRKRLKASTEITGGGRYFPTPAPSSFIPSGCTILDCALGGGWARRRISNIVGDKCLSGDTIVSVCRGSKLRKMTIATLYKRVNGNHFNRHPNAETTVLSDLGGYVGMNPLVSVQKTGIKVLYEVMTEGGDAIKVSKDHKFKTKHGWKSIASGLHEGSRVHCWLGKRTGREVAQRRSITYSVPFHLHAQRHIISGKNYKRINTSRLVIEAAMNNLSLKALIYILRNYPRRAATLVYTNPALEVHHVDGNPLDDRLENLELLEDVDHWARHADDMRRDTNRTVLHKIKSIKRLAAEPTYDITMEGPYNNFIADGFVVHNSSGKTLLAIEVTANFAMGNPKGKIYYREAEAAFDETYAASLGMPLDRVDFGKDKLLTIEDVFEDLERIIAKHKTSNRPGLYILDSLDALTDRKELDRDIDEGSYGTAKAKMLSQLFRRLTSALAKTDITVIIISQIRTNLAASFGDKTSRSGGRALDFYASQVLYLSQIQRLKKTIGGITRPIGITIKAHLKKSKVGPPFRECEFPIIFDYGVEDVVAGIDFLTEVKRLEAMKLNKNSAAKLLKWLSKMEPGEYAELRERVSKKVRRVWSEIEHTFHPTRRKYQ